MGLRQGFITSSEFMTPGCVVISEAASVADAAKAMAAHRVHAVLVVGARRGTPLGWITHRGLLGWIGRDRKMRRATEAITEQVRAIPAHESLRTATTRSRKAAPLACSCGAGRTRCPRAS